MSHSPKHHQHRLFRQFLTLLLVIAFCVFGVSFFLKSRLPAFTDIYPQMIAEPVQTGTKRDPFVFQYRGKKYDVEPVAEYILSGLVVSHNNIDSITDIYHDDDSVDMKDVCVIWGKNLQDDDFQKVDFWSNSWTCNWSYYGNVDFSNREVANNHLLAADTEIQKRIKDIRVGDQVILQGMLVDYSPEGTDWKRISSRTRDDVENGACEVMFVEAVEIVKAGQPLWNLLYDASKASIAILIILKIIFFLLHARYENRFYNTIEAERRERQRRQEALTYKGGVLNK